nr:hypothetical protein CFP56_32441 [Quercus suber]
MTPTWAKQITLVSAQTDPCCAVQLHIIGQPHDRSVSKKLWNPRRPGLNWVPMRLHPGSSRSKSASYDLAQVLRSLFRPDTRRAGEQSRSYD